MQAKFPVLENNELLLDGVLNEFMHQTSVAEKKQHSLVVCMLHMRFKNMSIFEHLFGRPVAYL